MTIDRVFGPIDISVSGMQAQDKSMEIISSNIANARTMDTGQGMPYRRLEAVLQSENEDMSALQRIYDPGNPQADANGYITMPNVQLPVEMMNLGVASRTYQANAAMLKRYQKMVETTLELLR